MLCSAVRSSRGMRAGLLINPAATEGPQRLNRFVLAALEALQPDAALQFVSKVLGDEVLIAAIADGEKKPSDVAVSVSNVSYCYVTTLWRSLMPSLMR